MPKLKPREDSDRAPRTMKAHVTVSDRHEPHHRLWGYGYADFAALLRLEEQTLRKWVSQGRFDPLDLHALVRLAVERNPHIRWDDVIEPQP